MKQTVNFSQFCDAFRNHDRNEQFTYHGKEVLFNALEQYEQEQCEQDSDSEIELDVIALCCEYSEDDYEEIASCYSIDLSECEDENGKIRVVEDYLNQNTWICGQPDSRSFVYRQF